METSGKTPAAESTAQSSSNGHGRSERRRRWRMSSENVRYFLPKSGSSSEKPELGEEMANEGAALVKAFKAGGFFFTLVAWSAATEIEGDEPRIVKQALKR